MRIARGLAIAALLWTGNALATSDESPYTVRNVVSTDPDPTHHLTEISLVAAEADVNIGTALNPRIAHVQTYNREIPGPTFRLNLGDTVIVHYVNKLGSPSAIHWHGVELENAMDGTPFTQDLIPASPPGMVVPGGTFLYKFKVTRPGIYWYHPHHMASTNEVFKGSYGMIVVTDPAESMLPAGVTLPSAATQTLALVLSDTTVCKAPGANDAQTYPPGAGTPWVGPGAFPGQPDPSPQTLCEAATALNEDGSLRGTAFNEGVIPNIQKAAGRFNEGQMVLTNGMSVGGRAGTPSAPLGLASGAQSYTVQPGQGLRLQIVNAATIRYMRLRLTDNSGIQIPLVRIGGEGGLLDVARTEGGVVAGFDFQYDSGELLLPPGTRADVVVSIPNTATGTLTMWTEDFLRTGPPPGAYTRVPTVPVAHFAVAGAPVMPAYSLLAGTVLRSPGNTVVPIPTAPLGALVPHDGKPGLDIPDITLTNAMNTLGINGVVGSHDPPPGVTHYTGFPHTGSARWAKLGDILQLTVTNTTGAHHPYHLHGFSMQPVSYTKTGSPTYNWNYTEYRDNVDVPPGYTYTFRIHLQDRALADGSTLGGGNGNWMFHCHIFPHAEIGMLSELVVVPPASPQGVVEKPDVNSDHTTVQVAAPGVPAVMTGTYHHPDGLAVGLTATHANGTAFGSVTPGPGETWNWSYTPVAGDLGSQYVYITATDTATVKDQAIFRLKVGTLPDGSDDGDPHLRTVDGTPYDFQGAGEFTLLRDQETGTEIQARQTPVTTAPPVTDAYVGLQSCVSVNTAVAARVGSHRVALQPGTGDRRAPTAIIDGKPQQVSTKGIDLGSGGRIIQYVVSGGNEAMEIDFPDGTVLTASPWLWSTYNVWLLNLVVVHTNAEEGVMGKVRQHWLPALSDGSVLGPKPPSPSTRYAQLYRKFARSWQVTNMTSLFQYAAGTSPATFSDPSWPPEKPPCVAPPRFTDPKAQPPKNNIDPKEAERECAPVKIPDLHHDCVFDVVTTGDPTIAKSYLQRQELQLRGTTTRVTTFREPTLRDKPITFIATVGRMSSAKDPVDGTLQFTVDGKAGKGLPLDKQGEARFTAKKLDVGTHTISASFTPGGKVNGILPSTSAKLIHTVVRHPIRRRPHQAQ